MANTNHPLHDGPKAAGERVEADRGGWISGPSITLQDVKASEIRPGDILLVTGESPVEVTDIKWGVYWLDDGYLPGIALGWKARTGNASGVLFRAGGDVLAGVAP
jgi:hypothetical protein